MIVNIDVPKNLTGSFKRVVRRIPAGLKKDETLIKTIVAYLQLGGEKLARQAVESAKQTHELQVAQRRKKAREEALIQAAEARQAAADIESGESEKDFETVVKDEDEDNVVKDEDEDIDEEEDIKSY